MRAKLASLAATGLMGLALVMGRPQLALASESAPEAASSGVEYAFHGVSGPWYTYRAAYRAACDLEDCGYCTSIVHRYGHWYVLYW